jgi:lathosterol oxidase
MQIHDSDMITGHPLEKIINGPAHHTLHHLYFTVNYGQYFTWADRAGGSYRQPDPKLDPMHEVTKQDEKEVPVEGAAAEGKTKTD